MKINELQKEAHAIARADGCYDTERSFGEMIVPIHYCLSAVWEEFQVSSSITEVKTTMHGNTLGVPIGIADVVIRVADMAENYGVVAEVDPRMEGHQWAIEWGKRLRNERQATWNFGDWVMDCHRSLANAASEHEHGSRPWAHYLGSFLRTIYDMAAHYGIDLDAAIEEKMAYMRGAAR